LGWRGRFPQNGRLFIALQGNGLVVFEPISGSELVRVACRNQDRWTAAPLLTRALEAGE
jgi:hypothetical protein